MANPALTVAVNGDTAGLNTALNSASGMVSAFGKNIPITRIELLVGAVTAAAAAMHNFATAGKNAAAEEAALEATLVATGTAIEGWEQKVNDAVVAGQALAVTDTETMAALQILVKQTKDLDAAIALLPGTMDLAVAATTDLETAATAVGKAVGGEDATLVKLADITNQTTTATDTLALAFANSAGQAQVFADSAEGESKRAADSFNELAESIGMGIAGAFEKANEALGPLILAFNDLMLNVLPLLNPLLVAMGAALNVMVQALTWLINHVNSVIDFFEDLIENLDASMAKMTEFLGLGDRVKRSQEGILSGIGIGVQGMSVPGGTPSRQATGRDAGAPGFNGASGVVINIYGDPSVIEAKVTKALRDYSRRNGNVNVLSAGRS